MFPSENLKWASLPLCIYTQLEPINFLIKFYSISLGNTSCGLGKTWNSKIHSLNIFKSSHWTPFMWSVMPCKFQFLGVGLFLGKSGNKGCLFLAEPFLYLIFERSEVRKDKTILWYNIRVYVRINCIYNLNFLNDYT